MNIIGKAKFCPMCGSDRFRPASEKSLRCEHCGFELFLNPSAATAAFVTNSRGELLVERRRNEPARGTLDLPGGFTDMHETAEEGVSREVLEETGLHVERARYLFSLPNSYLYSGIDIPTMDLFFQCDVSDLSSLHAADDAAEVMWVAPENLRPEDFGLTSIRRAVARFLSQR